ncbi:polysaccharide biosynthesis protein [Aestuariispira insulae]|uniref:UDP-glucose 4-epimerase n=1 Tax=Aestuariispira insulae TaxID=1461337 RepID=A0A3D9H481_9PROT|nr:polysaccharide biosynthesis protein [Aestuariispira insulae]RED44307.1 UDP-glucose 4-epimerase [Aestuariispira insulae]
MDSLKGKTILITGGTGSFGKTVTRRLLEEGQVARIVIYSRDEKKQHDMRLDFKHPKLQFEIGDVRDPDRIMRAMAGVDMVFHAAAMKQVPACEFFPMEAVKTNVIGTNNVIDAAIFHAVEKVVVLSTDKAAYPVNAMGCSKMMMEKLMIARAQASAPGQRTVLCGVRYGNVLYSRGSVVPLFVDQIRRGEALTLTNPDMTRFLMPLADAIDLVLHALRHGKSGDLSIHKAKAATIGDLARACLKLFSANNEIKIIGVRAGEKLHETLATAEELSRSEDLSAYWRIPCERGHEFDKYYVEGRPEVGAIDAFTSDNAERLNVSSIVELLKTLPEIQQELGIH